MLLATPSHNIKYIAFIKQPIKINSKNKIWSEQHLSRALHTHLLNVTADRKIKSNVLVSHASRCVYGEIMHRIDNSVHWNGAQNSKQCMFTINRKYCIYFALNECTHVKCKLMKGARTEMETSNRMDGDRWAPRGFCVISFKEKHKTRNLNRNIHKTQRLDSEFYAELFSICWKKINCWSVQTLRRTTWFNHFRNSRQWMSKF